jgi:hypothetical protein
VVNTLAYHGTEVVKTVKTFCDSDPGLKLN